MGDISSYPTRSSVSGTDRLFVASASSPAIESCTLAQVASLAGDGGGGGPRYAPGWGKFFATGAWNRPSLSALTWINQDGATAIDVAGGPIKVLANNGHWSFLGVDPGASAFTAEFLLGIEGRSDEANSMGVAAGNTTSGLFMPMYAYNNQALPNIYVDRSDSMTTGGRFISHQEERQPLWGQSTLGFKIQSDGTVINYYLSFDPLDESSWCLWYAEALSDYLISTNFVGLAFLTPSNPTYAPGAMRLYGMTLTTP
jgi:hypothetical protein